MTYRTEDQVRDETNVPILEQPHPTDVGWGFHGLAPVKPR